MKPDREEGERRMADLMDRDIAQEIEDTRGLVWGLEMSGDDITPEEIQRFRKSLVTILGHQQHGLEFMLHNHPGALKRYRAWADTLRIREPGETENYFVTNALGILVTYALSGNEEGLYYCLYGMGRGHTREEMLEIMALCFLWMGPRGMQTMARAAKMEPGWRTRLSGSRSSGPRVGPRSGAFKSGADFSTKDASKEDVEKIQAWYERYLGEVPEHIQFMAEWRPEVLEGLPPPLREHPQDPAQATRPVPADPPRHRARQASLARDGILLARGFGMKRKHVLEALTWGAFYGGTPALNYAHEASQGLLEDWPNGSAGAAMTTNGDKTFDLGTRVIDACAFHEWPNAAALEPYMTPGWRRAVRREGDLGGPLPTKVRTISTSTPSAPSSRPPGPRRARRGPISISSGVKSARGGRSRPRRPRVRRGAARDAAPPAVPRTAGDTRGERLAVENWLERDERLFGHILVSSSLPEEAAAEIRRIGGHPQMVAVALGTNGLGRAFGHPAYHAIYEAAAELDLPLVIQFGSDSASELAAVPTQMGLAATYGEA